MTTVSGKVTPRTEAEAAVRTVAAAAEAARVERVRIDRRRVTLGGKTVFALGKGEGGRHRKRV